MKKWGFRILVVAVIVVAVIYGIVYFIHSLSHERTDDAYVAGTVVPIAAEVKGKVINVYIDDNQYVDAGKPLLEIYQQDYLDLAKEKKDAVSQNEYDQMKSRWQATVARRQASVAAIGEAEAAIKAIKAKYATQSFKIKEAQSTENLADLDLTRTVVVAPISGRIAMKNIDPGKYVMPGQALFAIVKEDIWVIANFKETQIAKMAVGQPVEIKVDAYPSMKFSGHVDSLQSGTGSVFSLLPPENATGYFVKIVQRVPVKIIIDSKFDSQHPLWPGLSVVPTVDVSRQTGPKLSKK